MIRVGLFFALFKGFLGLLEKETACLFKTHATTLPLPFGGSFHKMRCTWKVVSDDTLGRHRHRSLAFDLGPEMRLLSSRQRRMAVRFVNCVE